MRKSLGGRPWARSSPSPFRRFRWRCVRHRHTAHHRPGGGGRDRLPVPAAPPADAPWNLSFRARSVLTEIVEIAEIAVSRDKGLLINQVRGLFALLRERLGPLRKDVTLPREMVSGHRPNAVLAEYTVAPD
ncbi:hypothetical protein [Streptomyces sp. NPDC008125]|uniref:hypothetical protein n=1 Tax=Streptomyces sp. NPDC008125 TaxID=3364811 RepID=UPI0036E2171A